MEVVKFHGTKHPITVKANSADIYQLQCDPNIKILETLPAIFKLDEFSVRYQFLDPKRAALDMELPVEILMEHELEIPEDYNPLVPGSGMKGL